MVEIRSRRNERIRMMRRLQKSRSRRELGLFPVEGIRHIGELLDSSFEIESLLYAPESLTSDFGRSLVERARKAGTPVFSTTADILDSLSEKQRASGLLAVARRRPAALAEVFTGHAAWAAAITAPQDPGNVGTILRTMDAFGFGGLVLLDGGADPWQPSTVRASMGALFTHPIVETDFSGFQAWAVGQNVAIYGTSAHAETELRPALDLRTPAILLLGSEREGLSPEQLAACEQVFRIPMTGRGTSLNLAVAAGVCMYALGGAKK